MATRLRHCVECPECGTRYLFGFSPYRNGSHLVKMLSANSDEYKLICACSRPPVCTRRIWDELNLYSVGNSAFARGYGGPEEIWIHRRHSVAGISESAADSGGERRRST